MEIKVNKEISLRLMQESEAEIMFQLIQENKIFLERWLDWVEFVKTPKDSIEKIQKDNLDYQSEKSLELGIFKNNNFIGRIGFHDLKNNQAEIGYWLTESENGKGIITESCKTLIRYAFREMNLHCIIIRMDVENIPSRKVPERLGFTCKGMVLEKRGKSKNHFVYTLLKTDSINF